MEEVKGRRGIKIAALAKPQPTLQLIDSSLRNIEMEAERRTNKKKELIPVIFVEGSPSILGVLKLK